MDLRQTEPAAARRRPPVGATDVPALVLTAVVVLAVIAFVPGAYAARWTPRAVVYLAAVPWGMLGLVRLVRLRDRAGIAAAVFLSVAALAALVSPAPARSLLPVFYRHESVAAWAAAFGIWALVRARDDATRRTIEIGFVGAVVFSTVIGVLQLAGDVDAGSLAMIGSRASGLSLNPVYLGALAAGAAAWCLSERLSGASRPIAVDLTLFVSTIGVWISGSRIALLALLAMVAVAVVRGRRSMLLGAGPWLVGGVVAGEVVRWFNRAVSGGVSPGATDRLGSDAVASGFSVRFDVWGFNLSAFARRPLLGHGPGSHPSAIQPHLTPEFAERTDPDQLLNNWTDAHNVVLELLTTVGVIGLAAALAFIVIAGREASGSAAWAVVPIAATWMLQPVSHVTLIPFFALLAVAGRQVSTDGWATGHGWRAGVVAASIAAGGWLLTADVLARAADESPSIASAERLAGWWWHDPLSARDGATLGLREAVVGGTDDQERRVMALAGAMTDRDPELAFWWVQRGDIEQIFGRDDEALTSYRTALERQPWSRDAIVSLLELDDDPARQAELRDRLRRLDSFAGDSD